MLTCLRLSGRRYRCRVLNPKSAPEAALMYERWVWPVRQCQRLFYDDLVPPKNFFLSSPECFLNLCSSVLFYLSRHSLKAFSFSFWAAATEGPMTYAFKYAGISPSSSSLSPPPPSRPKSQFRGPNQYQKPLYWFSQSLNFSIRYQNSKMQRMTL